MTIKKIACDAPLAWNRTDEFSGADDCYDDAPAFRVAVDQIRAGRLQSLVTRATHDLLTFEAHRYSLPVHLRCTTGRDVVTFVIPDASAVCGPFQLAAGSVVVIPAESEFDSYSKAAFRYFAIALPYDEFIGFSQSIGVTFDVERLTRFASVDGSPEFEQQLARTSELERRSSFFGSDELGTLRVREIMTSLCRMLAASRTEDRNTSLIARQARLVRSAGKYLERFRCGEFTVELLCDALGVPQRTLQQAFHAIVGVGPCRYARMLRLHAARHALVKGGATGRSVTDIGLSCGFEHLGRFSQYYRDFFGESPSETLRRNTIRQLVVAGLE